jgi:hypothetical protein
VYTYLATVSDRIDRWLVSSVEEEPEHIERERPQLVGVGDD